MGDERGGETRAAARLAMDGRWRRAHDRMIARAGRPRPGAPGGRARRGDTERLPSRAARPSATLAARCPIRLRPTPPPRQEEARVRRLFRNATWLFSGNALAALCGFGQAVVLGRALA